MFARCTCRLLKFSVNYGVNATTHCSSPILTRRQPPIRLVLHSEYRWKHFVVDKTQSIRSIWNKLHTKYLLFTNIFSSGLLMVFGDIIAQEIEYEHGDPNTKRYDYARIARMFVAGALLGPVHHYGYMWIDRILPVVNVRNTMKKILLDQIVMSPICLLIFFYSVCPMEGKTLQETTQELKEKFPFIYVMDWLIWPAAQYVNFYYLPLKYRVLFVNAWTALYDIFLSWVKHEYHVMPDTPYKGEI